MTPPKSTFLIFQDQLGEWRYQFLCPESIPRLLAAQGYHAKSSVYRIIDEVRELVDLEDCYHFKTNSRARHFFILQSSKLQILGTSRVHENKESLLTDIKVLQKEYHEAAIIERD